MSTIDRATSVVQPVWTSTPVGSDNAPPHGPQTRPPAADAKAAIYSDPTRRPAVLPTIYSNIPQPLRERRQWIMWDTFLRRDRSGGERWNKEPLRVWHFDKGDKKNAKSNDASTWVSFEYLRSVATAARGRSKLFPTPPHAGFVFAPDGGLVGIDIDKCRDPQTGELSGVAQKIVAELPGYWEASPSGTGIKGFHLGSLPADWKGKGRKVKVGDGPEEVEAYDRRRFFAVTGHRIEQATADVTANPEALAAFFAEFFPEGERRTRKARPPAAKREREPGEHAPREESTPAVRYTRSAASKEYPRAERVARARRYLRKCPGAVTGQGGGPYTFRVCVKVRIGFDLSYNDAYDLLVEWNRKCQPEWRTDTDKGPDSLSRVLTHASEEPDPRGFMLDRREQVDSDAASNPADDSAFARALVSLGGPPDHAPCGRRACNMCCTRRPLYTDRAGSAENSSTVPARAYSPIAAPSTIGESARAADSAQLFSIIGKAPRFRPCRHSHHDLREGIHSATLGTIDLLRVTCGRCHACQERQRYAEKKFHVSAALKIATHTWHGTEAEWDRLRHRLDRLRAKLGVAKPFGVCRIIAEHGRRAALLAIPVDPSLIPADRGLAAVTREDAGVRASRAIDGIPYRLPKGTWRIKANETWKSASDHRPQPRKKDRLYQNLGRVQLQGPDLQWAAETAENQNARAEFVPLRHHRVEDRLVVRLPVETEEDIVRTLVGRSLTQLRNADRERREEGERRRAHADEWAEIALNTVAAWREEYAGREHEAPDLIRFCLV